MKKNIIFKHIERNFYNLFRKEKKNKSIFINSIPKSGTHLLLNIMMQFGFKDYNNFITNYDNPLTFNKIKDKTIQNKFLKTFYNECTPCHLFYSEKLYNFILNNNLNVIFLYRDPFHTFVSEYFYIRKIKFSFFIIILHSMMSI